MMFRGYCQKTCLHRNSVVPVVLASMISGLCGCVEPIDLDSDESLPVVVECILKTDTVQTMKLYRMRRLSDTANEPIDDATACLIRLEKGTDIRDTVAMFYKTDGIEWKTSYKPEYGNDYELVVNIPGQTGISATTRFPEDLRLVFTEKMLYDGRHHFKDETDHSRWNPERIRCYGQEIELTPHNERDTVIFKMRTCEVRQGRYVDSLVKPDGFVYKKKGERFKVYDKPSEEPCKLWIFPHTDTTMVFFPNNYFGIYDEDKIHFKGTVQPFCDYAVTDHPGVDNFNITSGRLADLDWCNKPLCCRRANIACIPPWMSFNRSQWCTFMCPDLPLHKGFVRIDHPAGFNNGLSEKELETSYLYSESSFFVCGDYIDKDPEDKICISINSLNLKELSFMNEVHFLSDEYDAYLRDLYARKSDENNFVLSVYNYENVYSNINGGVGIFGADNVTWDEETRIYFSAKKKVRL